MTRPPLSTLKVRGVFTTFVTVILLALFAILPRMIAGFSLYLESGTSIFLPFMKPINVLWFLPKQLQVIPITAEQLTDICIFAFISHHIWALLYHFYMKIKRNVTLNYEMAEQFDQGTFSEEEPVNFFIMGDSTQISPINTPAQKISRLLRNTDSSRFPQATFVQKLYIPSINLGLRRRLRPLLKTKTTGLKSSFFFVKLYIGTPFLSNSAIHSSNFDLFDFTPAWEPVSNIKEILCSEKGGTL